MATMNKSEVVEHVAKATGLSKVAAGQAVDAVLDTITSGLKKGHTIQFTGFGAFAVTKSKARKGVNPRTGEEISIPARKTPKFRPGKGLKDSVA